MSSLIILYTWYGSRHARPNPQKEKIAWIRETNTHTHTILLIQGLLHPEQLLHGQDMLALPDALHLVCWTCAGISGIGRREVHDILVVWNGAGRNSISIFGPRNAQRTGSNAVLACGLSNDLTLFLGSMYSGIPLGSFRHWTHSFLPTSRCYKLRFLQFTNLTNKSYNFRVPNQICKARCKERTS
jgi:hypothetical protein